MSDPKQWEAYGRRGDCGRLYNVGTLMFARLSGVASPVRLRLTESPAGPYWGFVRTGSDRPTMVHYGSALFDMCFPGGARAYEAAGHGRVVRLTCEEADRA